jgi:hypothetical protein
MSRPCRQGVKIPPPHQVRLSTVSHTDPGESTARRHSAEGPTHPSPGIGHRGVVRGGLEKERPVGYQGSTPRRRASGYAATSSSSYLLAEVLMRFVTEPFQPSPGVSHPCRRHWRFSERSDHSLMNSAQIDAEQISRIARDISNPQTRAEYLDLICGDDHALRHRVTALLAAIRKLNSLPQKKDARGNST